MPDADHSISPLITKRNRPTVIKVTGKVSKISTGRTKVLSKLITTTAHKAEPKLSTCTPLNTAATKSNAPAFSSHLSKSFMESSIAGSYGVGA